MWSPSQVAIEIDDGTDHPVAVIGITTPGGKIELMAELIPAGRVLRLVGVHIQSTMGPNSLGISALRSIADAALERLTDYDAIDIEGATRTTGAGPGRVPGRLRFTRRRGVAPGGG